MNAKRDQNELLRASLLKTLTDGISLLESLEEEQYTQPLPEWGASSIGAHYRHHLDHVRLCLDGAEQGLIDYDLRDRSSCIQTDRSLAISHTRELLERIASLTDPELERPLRVVHCTCAEETERPECPSTLGRELLFLISHAVHHYALMNLIAKMHGVVTHDDFGVMPSTLAYQRSCDEPASPAPSSS